MQRTRSPAAPTGGRSRIGAVLGVLVLILGVLVVFAVAAVLKLGPGPLGGLLGRVDDPAAARSRSAAGCEPHFRPGDDGYVLYRVGGDGDGYLLCLVRKANGR